MCVLKNVKRTHTVLFLYLKVMEVHELFPMSQKQHRCSTGRQQVAECRCPTLVAATGRQQFCEFACPTLVAATGGEKKYGRLEVSHFGRGRRSTGSSLLRSTARALTRLSRARHVGPGCLTRALGFQGSAFPN